MSQSPPPPKKHIDPGITAYSSISDGQPEPPGKFEFGFIGSVQKSPQDNFQTSLSFTPKGGTFLQNGQFALQYQLLMLERVSLV